jgi:hypothetical protein
MPVIDIHSHFLPESWPDLAEMFGTPDWPSMRHDGDGKAIVMLGEEFVGKLIRSAEGFDDATRANLLGGNAVGFLGLEESQAKTA